MTEPGYLRHPHIARDLVTFLAEDDVWLASLGEAADGGGTRASRLTADRVPVRYPRLNPSATHVAWTSPRDGARSLGMGSAREAYATSVDGGPVTRLTYWGDRSANVRGWVGDDEVLVVSRTGQPNGMKTWAFAVPLDGPARRLDYGPAGDVAFGGGAVLVGSPMNFEPVDPADWKRYGGGAGGKIWYSPDGDQYTRILADVGNNLVNPMFVGERVAFLSDHEGTGALYSALPDGSDLRRHTDLGEYYARQATTDGERVVYQRAGEIWLLPSLDAQPLRLDIRLGDGASGATQRTPYQAPTAANLGSIALDTSGRAVAAEVRGTVHWLPVEDDEASRPLLAEPGVRARIPVVIPGRDAVVCASDQGGEDGLDVIPADGSPARRIGHGAFGRVLELAVAPNGRLAAVACADGRLLTVALDGEPVVAELARSTNEEVAGLTFSPDSALLAWSQPWLPERRAAQIRLARLADGTVADVTPRRFDDTSPAFTLDGRYLAFLSNRAFDSVHDPHTQDYGFVPGVRPYLVTLSATAPSPFTPRPDGSPQEPAGPEAAGSDASGQDAADLAGLPYRVVPFPVEAGRCTALRAVRDGVVWLDLPFRGEIGESMIGAAERRPSRLVRYDLARRERSVEAEGLDDYAVSADGSQLAYATGNAVEIKPVGDPDDKAVSLDLDRISVTVDPGAEWRQMYDETWRLMRDNFWRADMAGLDWAALGERYRPLVDRAGSADDLLDVLRELQGEVGTSHTGVLAPPAPGTPGPAQALLGADLAPAGDGTWRIVRILPGESSVAAARSPLAAPGVGAAAGDLVVAVDGQPVDPARGPNPLLLGKADQPVELTLRRDGADRRVVVVPLANEHAIRFHDLAARQRAAVREASAGRLGYLKLANVMSVGWADLHRDLYSEFACDGLILDLRETQGGDGSQQIAEKIARRVVGWELSRHAEPRSNPPQAPRGPVVVLADEYASSGGDLVVQTLKAYGVAAVVGHRTWGGAVGCDLRYQLVDGTITAQPKYAEWFDGVGVGVEGRGAEPDVEVLVAPHDWAAGRDPQLDTAVRLALEALAQRPPAVPPAL